MLIFKEDFNSSSSSNALLLSKDEKYWNIVSQQNAFQYLI